MSKLLMPKATAVWLVENTALSFEQIADFCGLHPLEVKGIADGDVAQGIRGLDPVSNGQLTRLEIEKAEKEPEHRLHMLKSHFEVAEPKGRRKPRYTPVSKRQERPDAIYWLLRNHPELTDAQVSKLVGTTKSTIQSIRDRSHWNMPNIKPVDPVSLGLCSQIDLDEAVKAAADRKAREDAKAGIVPTGPTLQPMTQSLAEAPKTNAEDEEMDDDAVFARLKGLGEPKPA